MANLCIVSLNCHGLNAGTVDYVRRISVENDFILLQETWLCIWCVLFYCFNSALSVQ